MKKTRISGLFGIILLLVLFSGCSKKDSNPPDNTVSLHAGGSITSNGNPTYATGISVGLVDMNHSGIGIEGAVVKVNGMVLEDKGDGAYTLLLTSNPITAGTNITLTIDYSGENYTVSTVMPESGNSTNVVIPGCASGSYLLVSNNV
jgi:hypothetical protein